MIDPITAVGLATSAYNAIKQGVAVGRVNGRPNDHKHGCGTKMHSKVAQQCLWYDRVFRVSYLYVCSARFVET